MTPSCIALLLVSWGALIDVQDLPWRDGETTAFVADFDRDGRGEVGVLFENRLEVFEVYLADIDWCRGHCWPPGTLIYPTESI